MKTTLSPLLILSLTTSLLCAADQSTTDAERQLVVCFGDSITKRGYNENLGRLLDVDTVNTGVGGHNSAQGLHRMQKDVLDHDPDVVVILFGTNDSRVDSTRAFVSAQNYATNLNKMIDACISQHAKVVLCTLPPIDQDAYFKRHERADFVAVGGLNKLLAEYRDAAIRVGSARQIPVVDLNTLLLQTPEWLSPDGVHPSERGTAIIAKLVADTVAPLLRDHATSSQNFTGDYTYSCWLNGWRKNSNDDSADVFAVETSHYGFTVDVADFGNVSLGPIVNPGGYERGLETETDRLRKLPPADLSIEIMVDGVAYSAKTCAAGLSDDVKRLSSARLWESGRYVQHYDFLKLDFRDAGGNRLDCDARLDLFAWPENLTFTLIVSGDLACKSSELRLGLQSELGDWHKESAVVGPWKTGQDQRVSIICPMATSVPERDVTITVNTKDGAPIPVSFDTQKNCHVATAKRVKRNWRTGYTDIRNYDEFEISVAGPDSVADPDAKRVVPFLLDLRPPANVTGVCPILCDEEGRPLGIPVQLSKNWHNKSTGSYLMAYAMLPAKQATKYRLRIVYGFYGTLPSASHAQLSLVGYGGNGRWDQLAIGCWGESICFDVDMSCVDVAVTDIRMLMNRSGKNGKKWSWTNAGWGGDWLNIVDENQPKYFPNNMKTAYLSHGPCLTDVRHDGYYGSNQEVKFSGRVQTSRTDDYCRTFQTLSYTFLRDVSAQDIWLFKLGRTHRYHTPLIAYGNADDLIKQQPVPGSLRPGQPFINQTELAGPAPHWVALPGATEAAAVDPKPNGYRALIIRRYNAVIGGETYTTPTISAPVHRSTPNNLDIEILPPAGVRDFHAGDRIELEIELITLPRQADDYYGPNEAFRRHLTEAPESWRTTYREAQGNQLEITVSGGTKTHDYPLVIRADQPEVTLDINGGVGAVPVSFAGLTDNKGNRLYQLIDGVKVELDQSVHGNDFWQIDFDIDSQTFTQTFNLPLDELPSSTWIFAQ